MQNQVVATWCEKLGYNRNKRKTNFDFSFEPEKMKTKRDPIVEELMLKLYGKKKTRQYFELFPQAKTIENKNGILLEMFIKEKLSQSSDPVVKQWFRSSEVKNCDFVHPTYNPVQIKNRNNTENAASKSVRKNKPISHWYRFDSKTGRVQWEALNQNFHTENVFTPDSEKEYLEFCLQRYEPFMKNKTTFSWVYFIFVLGFFLFLL